MRERKHDMMTKRRAHDMNIAAQISRRASSALCAIAPQATASTRTNNNGKPRQYRLHQPQHRTLQWPSSSWKSSSTSRANENKSECSTCIDNHKRQHNRKLNSITKISQKYTWRGAAAASEGVSSSASTRQFVAVVMTISSIK